MSTIFGSMLGCLGLQIKMAPVRVFGIHKIGYNLKYFLFTREN